MLLLWVVDVEVMVVAGEVATTVVVAAPPGDVEVVPMTVVTGTRLVVVVWPATRPNMPRLAARVAAVG